MDDKLCGTIVDLYDQEHVGVTLVQGVLSAEELQQLHGVFSVSTTQFRPLKFGGATRWDFTEDDFCKHSILELVREKFRHVAKTIANMTVLNQTYQERFCVQFYPMGSSGIKPHRDTEHSVNCVVIFVVSGNNKFFAAKDKACKNVTEFPTQPGDVIIMRGPRNIGDSLPRPIHYIGEVKQPRYVIICRHVNLEGLSSLNVDDKYPS